MQQKCIEFNFVFIFNPFKNLWRYQTLFTWKEAFQVEHFCSLCFNGFKTSSVQRLFKLKNVTLFKKPNQSLCKIAHISERWTERMKETRNPATCLFFLFPDFETKQKNFCCIFPKLAVVGKTLFFSLTLLAVLRLWLSKLFKSKSLLTAKLCKNSQLPPKVVKVLKSKAFERNYHKKMKTPTLQLWTQVFLQMLLKPRREQWFFPNAFKTSSGTIVFCNCF